MASLIEVDYSPDMLLKDVITNFAVTKITSNKSLYWFFIVLGCHFMGGRIGPTRVPNIALPFSSAHFGWNYGTNLYLGLKVTFPCPIRKYGQLVGLVCPGLRIDTIN
jgi:hypothetical protein